MILKMTIKHILILMIIVHSSALGQKILFIGGTAHLGNGEKINNSLVSIVNDKFDLVADANKVRIDPNAFDTIIKIYGKHIYPSFISPNNTLGITEIDAVRATRDFNETGEFNPNIRSLIAYNTDSRILKTIRTNGILITQCTPRGGIISGTSSIMYLDGWNWEDAAVKVDDGIHINWPSSYNTYGWWANPGETNKNKKYTEYVNKIKTYFEKAKAFSENPTQMDNQMKSMIGLFNGEKNLYVNAKYAKDIRESIRYFSKIGIKKIVLIGGEDILNAINIIKEYNVPVILDRVHSLPRDEASPIDEPFSIASKLKDQDILFCFSYHGDMEAMGSRNLPFTAGTAVAYGLNMEHAISALSLNAAKILGISKTHGSIETGKFADFFISSGDALDIKTNNVEYIYIHGKSIDLNNHQKDLYEKYKLR